MNLHICETLLGIAGKRRVLKARKKCSKNPPKKIGLKDYSFPGGAIARARGGNKWGNRDRRQHPVRRIQLNC